MRIAKNERGELVYCQSGKILDKKQKYFCPKCGEPVILHTTKKEMQYFSHQARKFSEGESLKHREGKSDLALWLERSGYQTTLELTMENHEQRADVICEDDRMTVVVEYQCSPISITELQKRDKGYQNLGYQSLWLLGEAYYELTQFSDTLAFCMLYHPSLEYFLVFLVEGNLIIKAHIQLDNYTKKYTYHEFVLPLKEYNAKKLVALFLSCQTVANYRGDYRMEYFTKEKKQQVLLNTQEENRQFLLSLYLQHVHLFQLPKICWQLPKYNMVFKTPNYIWRGYVILWLIGCRGRVISLRDCLDEVWRLVHTGRIRLYASHQLKRLKSEIYYFLQELVRHEVLVAVDPYHWQIKNNFEIISKKW